MTQTRPLGFQPSLGLNVNGSFANRSLQVRRASLRHTLNPKTSVRFAPHQAPAVKRRSPGVVTCIVQGWETLTASSFDQRVADKSLAICFVGMSNCGKSHWSRQLKREREFLVVSVDEEIERSIEPELTALGFSGIDGMAEWMGFPSDERFAANQARYLEHEERITAAAQPADNANSVLDTTGSVIYLTSDTISRIKREYLVVHLEASDDMLEFMTKNYFETPKPVVWGDAFRPIEGETANQSLRRCYPDLLRERRKRYEAMAHVTIPATISLSRKIDLDGFLNHLKENLR